MKTDALCLTTMHSGHLCLNLSEAVSWVDFPQYAEELVSNLGASVLERVDLIDCRLWRVEINHTPLRLVFDDYPLMVSLEALDEAGDLLLRSIFEMATRAAPNF